jgi:hypothetical protein
MMTEALGHLFNAHYPADDVYVNLAEYGGVTFLVHEVDGATVVLVTFSNNAAGGSTSTPDVIDHYYGKSADVSAGVWHRTAVSPASETFTKADGTEDLVAVTITAAMCPDGKPYVKCAADGSGTVMAILHSPAKQRYAPNLASVTA